MNNINEIDSFEMSKHLKLEYHSILRIINKNRKYFDNFGELIEKNERLKNINKGGRPNKIYILNEKQYYFFITLLKNDERGIKEKIKLIKIMEV